MANNFNALFLDSTIQEQMLAVDGTSTEGIYFGGPRLMTFMIYLTTVEVGGHTIFPQIGISIKPIKGSALFWFNRGAQDNFDSRVNHFGCPVVYGNKWIINKWIKWFSNFNSYPCHINKHHYSINE